MKPSALIARNAIVHEFVSLAAIVVVAAVARQLASVIFKPRP